MRCPSLSRLARVLGQQEQCFQSARPAVHLYSLTQVYSDSSAPCLKFVQSDLAHPSCAQIATQVHYINDTMLIGPSEQEETTTLDLLVTHMHISTWEINLTETQRPPTSVKFLGVQGCGGGACRDSPPKVKDNLVHLAPPTTKKEV